MRYLDNDYSYGLYSVLDGIGHWFDYVVSYAYQSLHDMTPTGWPGADGFIDNLNANTGLEQATQRRAMRFELDAGYLGGPFRLVQDGSLADDTGNAIVLYGDFLAFDGNEILMNLSYDDYNYFEHQSGAWAAIYQGNDIAYFPYWWHNDMIGGVPNDAIVGKFAQGMPNGTTVDVPTGYMHTDETSHPLSEIKQQLLILIGQ